MDQQFSLSWNNFHGNLTKGFAGLLGNGEFVDVTIAVEGHLLQAHKVILSICSPYFKKMFQLNPCQHPIVVLRDVTHKAMRDLLQFMYHGEVSVKREDLTSFICTAEVLQIKGLTNKETDEEEHDKEQTTEAHNKNPEIQSHTPEPETCISDSYDTNTNDESNPNTELEFIKQRQFIEKLQRLSNLKRKSDEFLQKTYYSDLLNAEKRAKILNKPTYNIQNNHNIPQTNNYDNLKNIYEDNPIDISSTFRAVQASNTNKDLNDKCNDNSTPDNTVELKTECDEMDIIVTDPAICTPTKSFDGPKESKKDSVTPAEYHSPQDNCTSLNYLFMDLKNLVNGKVSNHMLKPTTNEEYPRSNTEHRLVTIPQKKMERRNIHRGLVDFVGRLGSDETLVLCVVPVNYLSAKHHVLKSTTMMFSNSHTFRAIIMQLNFF